MSSKPFINLYHSPRGFYFYDVNRDSIVTINSELYDFLDEKKSFEDLSPDNQNCINSLKEEGYLSSKHYSEIKHPSTDSLEYEIKRRSKQLILQVTQSCNLVCSYCPYANKTDGTLQRNHSNKMMTWETAKEAIDLFFEHSIDSTSVSFSFYGGEPVIAFDLIRKCVEYIDNQFIGKKISFNMTTNATLLTDEILDYLYIHDFKLLFSIDGPEEIHDINRLKSDGTGSFKIAFENLRKAVKKYSIGTNHVNSRIGTNTVINPSNDADLMFSLYDDEIYSKYRVMAQASVADDINLKEKIQSSEQYRKKIRYQYFLGWLDCLKIVNGLKVLPFVENGISENSKNYSLFKRGSNGLSDTGAPGGPCIPGQRRRFVNVEGNIYPCERVSEISDVMKIGTITEGIDLNKSSDLLNIGKLTAEKCKNCYAASNCNICAKNCINENEYDAKEKIKYCRNSINSFDAKIRTMILMKEIRTLYKRRLS